MRYQIPFFFSEMEFSWHNIEIQEDFLKCESPVLNLVVTSDFYLTRESSIVS